MAPLPWARARLPGWRVTDGEVENSILTLEVLLRIFAGYGHAPAEAQFLDDDTVGVDCLRCRKHWTLVFSPLTLKIAGLEIGACHTPVGFVGGTIR